MTPQERELITELFDRLSSLESTPRDAQAERAIAEGLSRAPNAVYALVQTVLVQDEALKRANARIQALEGADGSDSDPHQGGSFLDNMRGALFGRDAGARASVPPVPPVRTGATSQTAEPPPYAPPPSAPAPGGSFLGTAAAAAAGTIGGSLLLNGIRSAFGQGHPYAGAFEPGSPSGSPWEKSSAGAADSDLARQAGGDDVGKDRGRDDDQHAAGRSDSTDADDADSSDDDDADSADDDDFDGDDFDDDSDVA
jgi:hypothetical protein